MECDSFFILNFYFVAIVFQQESEISNMENRNYFSLHCVQMETQLIHANMEALYYAFHRMVHEEAKAHAEVWDISFVYHQMLWNWKLIPLTDFNQVINNNTLIYTVGIYLGGNAGCIKNNTFNFFWFMFFFGFGKHTKRVLGCYLEVLWAKH